MWHELPLRQGGLRAGMTVGLTMAILLSASDPKFWLLGRIAKHRGISMWINVWQEGASKMELGLSQCCGTPSTILQFCGFCSGSFCLHLLLVLFACLWQIILLPGTELWHFEWCSCCIRQIWGSPQSHMCLASQDWNFNKPHWVFLNGVMLKYPSTSVASFCCSFPILCLLKWKINRALDILLRHHKLCTASFYER